MDEAPAFMLLNSWCYVVTIRTRFHRRTCVQSFPYHASFPNFPPLAPDSYSCAFLEKINLTNNECFISWLQDLFPHFAGSLHSGITRRSSRTLSNIYVNFCARNKQNSEKTEKNELKFSSSRWPTLRHNPWSFLRSPFNELISAHRHL